MRCRPGATLLLALAACSLPPLRGKAEVGKDPYAVFVANAAGGSDLFAQLPVGGAPIALTFSPVEESGPALSPDGAIVVFLRSEGGGSPRAHSVWLLNLLSGTEREVSVPAALHADPDRVGWSVDGRVIYIRAGRLTLRVAAPPAEPVVEPVPLAERATADSSFFVLLGAPAFARAVRCSDSLCVVGRDGASSPLVAEASGAVRWGPDSVGYFRGGTFEIRPLGPGRVRLLNWDPRPSHPRDLTFFPGHH